MLWCRPGTCSHHLGRLWEDRFSGGKGREKIQGMVSKILRIWLRLEIDGVLKRAVSDEFKTPSDDSVKQPQTPRRS